MTLYTRPFSKYLCGFDTFIRHRCLADLIKKFGPSDILDVGGEGFFSSFVKVPVVTINVKSADVRYSGVVLPFKDGSFDAAVSCDTIEHLPKTDRPLFISELLRVSRKGAVVCAPFGTPGHIEAEKIIAGGQGLEPSVKAYLNEHILHGLPTPDEVASFAGRFKGSVYYQGDFRRVEGSSSSRFLCYFSLVGTAVKNLFTEIFRAGDAFLKLEHTWFTNRFFLRIKKD